jgi:hypothetical protein
MNIIENLQKIEELIEKVNKNSPFQKGSKGWHSGVYFELQEYKIILKFGSELELNSLELLTKWINESLQILKNEEN